MMHERRYFYVVLKKGGKLEIHSTFSSKERKAICENKENLARPITWKEWLKIPKDMKI